MWYRMYAKSIHGPKYKAKGWECQDTSSKLEFNHTQVIAVADGHGSSECFRSEYGSLTAIKTAFRQTILYCKDMGEALDTTIRFSETGIFNFKYSLWNEWRHAIREHWDACIKEQENFGEGEVRYGTVSDKYKSRYTSEDASIVEHYLYTAYGTTLLLAISIESQLLILQIGDGTCVVLQKNGDFCVPVPSDDHNFLNVSVSLCEEDANLKIRHAVIDCDVDSVTMPVAVFLSSDGLDDCYPVYNNEQYLYKLYSVIFDNIINFGFDATEAEISDHLLPGMTAKSSQDDISLAYFITEDIELIREAYKSINPAYKPLPEEVK